MVENKDREPTLKIVFIKAKQAKNLSVLFTLEHAESALGKTLEVQLVKLSYASDLS